MTIIELLIKLIDDKEELEGKSFVHNYTKFYIKNGKIYYDDEIGLPHELKSIQIISLEDVIHLESFED
jgi:hypothetical protein